MSLMVARFGGEEAPAPRKAMKYAPKLEAGKLVIDMFDDGECPVSYVTRQLVKEAARDFAEKISIKEFDMKDKTVREKCSNMRGIFLDGKEDFFGYPGEIGDIREVLRKELQGKE